MPILLQCILCFLAGACTVGLTAALAVWRDEILENPTLPGRAGKIAAIVLCSILVIIALLTILYPATCP